MLRKWLIGVVAVASLFSARTVVAEKVDFDQGVDVKGIVASLQEKVAQEKATEDKAGIAEWTVMVYINAKNNLESFGVIDTNEMEVVGSNSKVKIAVELGRLGNDKEAAWKGQRRYVIQKDGDFQNITSPVLQDIPTADMGDWRHLVEFVTWAKAAAPAKKYMLVVWNHGSGWDKKRADVGVQGISYDDETGNHISTPQLGQALASMGKIDIYASDACLMQMAEVSYQLKDYTEYVVGAEETEPGDGYTYNTMLAPLAGNPAMSAGELARVTAEAFTAHYAAINQGATQSVVRSAALARLPALLDGWTAAVMAANEGKLVKAAHRAAQDFYISDNKDLVDFVKRVSDTSANAAVKSKGAELQQFLLGEVITANAVTGSNYSGANGLAIYLPNYGFNSSYNTLSWAAATQWPKFAQWVGGLRD